MGRERVSLHGGGLRAFGLGPVAVRFLNEESCQLLFTSQKTSDGKPTGYGIGWFVRNDKQGRPFYYHTSGQQGSTALIFLQPYNHLVVVLVCNLSDADIIGEGKELADLFEQALPNLRRWGLTCCEAAVADYEL